MAGAPPDKPSSAERTVVRGDPLIGTTLGEYTVLERLGEGGMGVVYRGENALIGKAVAIKVLKPALAEDPANIRRLLDEARTVNAIHHPGIVDIFAFGQTPDGSHYVVMELMVGEPLDLYLRDKGRLETYEALRLLDQILSALASAHAVGVVHRDVKPGNIFLQRLHDGTLYPRLLDFGLAKRGTPGAALKQTEARGTPLYAAPEQARGEAITGAADLYALGCVAYEMLCGRPPFTSANLVELLGFHANTAPRSLKELAPEVPSALNEWVMSLLQKDPLARPNAGTARRTVERLLRELPNSETVLRQLPLVRRGETATPPASSDVVPTLVDGPRPASHSDGKTEVHQAGRQRPRSRLPLWPLWLVLACGAVFAATWWARGTTLKPGRSGGGNQRVEAVGPHTVADVQRRAAELERRIAELAPAIQPVARSELAAVVQQLKAGASPERCWADLAIVEASHFAEP